MKSEPVAVLIHYRAKPGMADVAAEELSALIATVASEERACISINLHRDVGDPSVLMLYERWVDKESYLGEHMRTPHILSFIERAGGFLTGPPEISIWESLSEVVGSGE
jgi:quinol monooxygenase YgiN